MEEGFRLSQGRPPAAGHWADRLPPLVLAYVGDAVYELYVRTRLAPAGEPVEVLHRRSVEHVRAVAQAAALRALEPLLTPAEQAVVRRGRNAKGAVPRSTSPADYRLSTGLEALFGYLYLAGETERLVELLHQAYAASSPDGLPGAASAEVPPPTAAPGGPAQEPGGPVGE